MLLSLYIVRPQRPRAASRDETRDQYRLIAIVLLSKSKRRIVMHGTKPMCGDEAVKLYVTSKESGRIGISVNNKRVIKI